MVRHYIKVFLRNIRKHKGYSAINIASLAVGMSFAVLILLWVQFEWSFDRFHDNLDRLYSVAFTTEDGKHYSGQMVGALAEYLESEYPEIESASRMSNLERWKLGYGGKDFAGSGRYVDPQFLKMFSFPFIEGDAQTALTDPSSIIITEKLAERIFGKEDPVGRAIQFGNQTLTVTGVMKNNPDNTDIGFEFLVSCAIGSESYKKWDIKCIQTFVLLEPGSDPQTISGKIKDVYNDHNQQDTKNNLYLAPFKDGHLYELGGGGRYVYVLIFSALAVAILLIACINFMNLATARSETRFREIGVKKVFGANRRQLVLQTLAESVMLSLIALLFAFLIVELLMPFVNSVTGLQMTLDYSGSLFILLLGVALLTGIISGSYPAFYLSSFLPIVILRNQTWAVRLPRWGKGKKSSALTGNLTLRKILVTVQFTVSIMLIIAVTVIYKQLDYIKNMNMGFEKEQVVLFNMPGSLIPQTTVVKSELLKNSQIEKVTVSTNSLVEWWTSFGIGWEGKQPGQSFDIGFNAVDYNYLETFQMKMAEGRFFSREFPSDARQACVVNEATVRAMGITDPVGRDIVIAPGSSWEQPATIIGVIRDFNTESAYKEIRPFMLGLSEYGRYMCIRIKPDDISGTIGFIRNKIKEIAPDVNVSLRFFDTEFDRLYRVEEITGKVVVYVTLMAIFISGIGLLGLTAYAAQRRTKEIGIRKVMGATVPNIVGLLSKEFLALVIIANLIAWPAAYLAMTRWLENFAFRIDLSWGVFALAAFITTVITFATVSTQAVRTASINPVDSLRHE
ncbi:MAG: ABC transporter permease [candidate division Zixibacteria bacterium]|nr:ABC transporter permease [candidate division Zixibacteria bacterium]